MDCEDAPAADSKCSPAPISARSSRESSSETDEVGTPKYEVEVILAARSLRGSNGLHHEYLVKWHGYPGEDTWEPSESFINDEDSSCDRLLRSFWAEIGYFTTIGLRAVRPSQKWIDSEINYFQRNYAKHETEHSQPLYIYKDGQLTRFE